jgi:hypothetical protein
VQVSPVVDDLVQSISGWFEKDGHVHMLEVQRRLGSGAPPSASPSTLPTGAGEGLA